MKKTILFTIIILLTGCKQEIFIEVSTSQLKKAEEIQSDLIVSLSSCSDYNDSRQPSSELIEAKKTIPYIFTGASYIECFKQKFDSFAKFSIPIAIDKKADNKYQSDQHINLFSSGDILLSLNFPKVIADKIKNANKNPLTGNNDLTVYINLTNDQNKALSINGLFIYVQDTPLINGTFELPPSQTVLIRLSDVAVSHAIQHGQAPILKR